jgi:hypothetical protein
VKVSGSNSAISSGCSLNAVFSLITLLYLTLPALSWYLRDNSGIRDVNNLRPVISR